MDIRTALNNWLTFLKEVADNDIHISFNVIVAVSDEGNFLMMYCSFNGPPREIDALFGPWLSKDPKPDYFKVFNYTQNDISRELGIPFYLNNPNKDKNTAYAFLDISCDIAPGVSWKTPDNDPYTIEMGEKFLQKLIDAAAPIQSIVGAYINYIDSYLPNWETMYYRNNRDRL